MYTVNFRGNIFTQKATVISCLTLPSAIRCAVCERRSEKKPRHTCSFHRFFNRYDGDRMIFHISGIFYLRSFSDAAVVFLVILSVQHFSRYCIFSDVRHNHYHYYFNNQKLVHHVFATAPTLCLHICVAFAKLILSRICEWVMWELMIGEALKLCHSPRDWLIRSKMIHCCLGKQKNRNSAGYCVGM